MDCEDAEKHVRSAGRARKTMCEKIPGGRGIQKGGQCELEVDHAKRTKRAKKKAFHHVV